MRLTAKREYQNTTVRVPKPVYEQAKSVIGRAQSLSFNEFVIQAIEEKVQRLAEAEIDAAFAQMADDPDYQRDSAAMAREFEKSDWEAIKPAGVRSSPAAKKGASGSGKSNSHARTAKARTR